MKLWIPENPGWKGSLGGILALVTAVIGSAVIGAVVIGTAVNGPAFADEKPEMPFSFTTHTNTAGPIVLKLDPVELVTRTDTPQTILFHLTNRSDTALECQLAISTIETIRILDLNGKNVLSDTRTVTIPAQGTYDGQAAFVVLPGTYSAHYPIHVIGRFDLSGQAKTVHAVRVIETKLPVPDREFQTTVIRQGGVSLIGKSYTASRDYPGEPAIELGRNWNGSDSVSKAGCNVGMITADGNARHALICHPPYAPKGGSLYLSYPVELPNRDHVSLSYGCAVRTVFPPEPPTDGVTFRIWARSTQQEKTTGQDKQLLDELHTISTSWVDRTVDLTAFAGKRIELIVEFNPGPKNNTTCDGCFLSGLVINGTAGSFTGVKKSYNAHLSSQRFSFELNDGYCCYIYPGANGLPDSKIDIGKPSDEESFVSFDGLNIAVGGLNLLSTGTVYTQAPKLQWQADENRLAYTAEILNNDQLQSITVYVYQKNGVLVFDVPAGNPAEIRDIYLKAADRSAKRVYFGHGFVIDNPKGYFAQGHGGHELAASHVGFDFDNGTSIVMGSPDAPNRLIVQPEKNLYILDNSGVCRLEVIPGSKGAFAAAIAFRDKDPWHSGPSKGTVRKRGRLTYDVWGGSYAENLRQLELCSRYGVDDALYLKHVWQCWGYDVRLPDIWNTQSENPVLASLGPFEDLKALAERCKELGIPFGLHDNYIDFYPDAEGYTYDCITFHQNGTPRRAWVNHGAEVLSYQWRPDLFKPFLDRNMALGKQYLPTMDAYFVDVFSSMKPFDFYTRDGQFHPKAETQQHWKECFETIGSALSHTTPAGETETAITTSEAAADYLIGSLDGADCQWMLIDPERGGAWRKHIPCENWARTPWFTAVNHTNFSRHGAGYQDRYNAVRNGSLHSVTSDDYISAEILGGLDLMVVHGCVFPGAVRKHYLAQHVVRQLADQEIVAVEFADDNIRRQCVTWTNGTKVYVNRGEGDWAVGSYLLPKYGFAVFDKSGRLMASICRNTDNTREVVEVSQRADDSFYVYGRGKTTVNILPIQPVLKSAQILDGGTKVQTTIDWKALEPTSKDLAIFVHIFEPKQGYGFTPQGWYAGGEWPTVPTSEWKPEQDGKATADGQAYVYTSGRDHVYTIPEGLRNGVYHVMVGLYDSKGNGHRYPLMGEDAQENRYSVAKFRIQNGKVVGEIEPVEITESMDDFSRLLANRTPVSFRGVTTLGSVTVSKTANGWSILPLPMIETFDVTLDESVFGQIDRITCGEDSISFTRTAGRVTFTVTAKDAARYEIIRTPL